MHKFYRDYYWENGRPRGQDLQQTQEEICYRIVVDPYYKRYSIEKYENQQFLDVIYDSALFDFRWLKPQEQVAWQKVKVVENEKEMTCLIKNQDDRVIAVEKYYFEEDLCRRSEMFYPNGKQLATQVISYTKLGDEKNLVILLDAYSHPVVIKEYEADEDTGEFSLMIKEDWNTKDIPIETNTLDYSKEKVIEHFDGHHLSFF